MFHELDQAIRQLLNESAGMQEIRPAITFDAPTRDWRSQVAGPTLNCFLYDVRENQHLRGQLWQEVSAPPVAGADGNAPAVMHRKRSPLRVDCGYLVSAWAAQPADEHLLLTLAFLALAAHPILPARVLTGALRHAPLDLRTRLAGHDVLPNMVEVWNSLGNELRPSLSYVVTLALDPWSLVTTPLTTGLRFDLNSVDPLSAPAPVNAQAAPSTPATSFISIGGVVRRRSDPAHSVPGAAIRLEGTNLATRSDLHGRYRFHRLRPGNYTVSVRIGGDEPTACALRVALEPGEAYDLIV